MTSGRDFEIEVNPFTSVGTLKDLVAPEAGIPAEKQRIFLLGKELIEDIEGKYDMQDYGITKAKIIKI
ncbi:hypothetical protein ZWY2020_018994 [Hordeum vulgare]|nr:hypothetical protein ZWY2020_018994 [Hordeum vulgare]